MTQQEVLHALKSRKIWNEVYALLRLTDFDDEYAEVFKAIERLYNENKTKDSFLWRDLKVYCDNMKALSDVARQTIPADSGIALQAIKRFIMKNRILEIFKKHAEKFQQGRITESELESIGSDIIELQRSLPSKYDGINLTRVNIKKLLETEKVKVKLPTPSQMLTEQLDGGPASGEILCVLAPTDGGKTTYLLNTARHNADEGKLLLYVTLQTSVRDCIQRYYCSALNKPIKWIAENQDKVEEYKEKLKEKNGEVRFVDSTHKECSILEIARIAESLQNEKGRKVDGVLIDYADLVVSSRRYQSPREEMKLLWREMKRVSNMLQTPIVTASQANRVGAASERVELVHIAESWAKATDSDLVVAITRTKEDIVKNKALLRIIKTKKSGGYKEIDAVFDPIRCRIE